LKTLYENRIQSTTFSSRHGIPDRSPDAGISWFSPFFVGCKYRSADPPKRLVFLGFGFGVTQETWFPDREQTGTDYDLPEGLKPLSRHKKDITVVQGCSNQISYEAQLGQYVLVNSGKSFFRSWAEREKDFSRGFTEHLIEYALGRPFGFTDEHLANEVVGSAKSRQFAVSDFIHALVQSKAFRM